MLARSWPHPIGIGWSKAARVRQRATPDSVDSDKRVGPTLAQSWAMAVKIARKRPATSETTITIDGSANGQILANLSQVGTTTGGR